MLTFLVCVLLIVLYVVFKKHASVAGRLRNYGNKIPGPKPLPIIGNILEFGFSTKSIFEHLKWLTREYGPIYRIWLGPKLGVVLADPHYAELLVAGTEHMNKSSLYTAADFIAEKGLVLSSGELWKTHRKIVAPTMGSQHLPQFLEVFNSHLDKLIESLRQYENGPGFDVIPLFSRYTLDTICDYAVGVKVNPILDQGAELFKAINCLGDAILKRVVLPWLRSDIIFRMTPLGRKVAECLPVVLGLTRRAILSRKQQLLEQEPISERGSDIDSDTGVKKQRSFLDHFLLHAEGAQLSDQEIEHEVTTMLLAGYETTATALSYTCWLLAKHEDVQEKVVEELRNVFEGSLRNATPQDLSELKYLEQVIKESMRVLTPVPAFARLVKQDLTLDKYVIPAGSEVIVNVYMLHRHPEHFPDPERFDPDRFSPGNSANRHQYAFIPFSAGPRICVGYKFAMYEMKTTLSKLLRCFKILPPANPFQELDLTMHIVLKSQNGVPVKLEPRNFYN